MTDSLRHYHLFMGAANAAPMQTMTITDYDTSIRQFLKLGKSVYGRYEYWNEGLNYQNLLKTSEFGEGAAMTIGMSSLCIQWIRCRKPCLSPSWN